MKQLTTADIIRSLYYKSAFNPSNNRKRTKGRKYKFVNVGKNKTRKVWLSSI